MTSYLTVTCRLPAAAEDHLTQAMAAWPVLGCQVEDAGEEVDVTIYLEEEEAAAVNELVEELRRLGASELSAGRFAEEDWLSEYRRHVVAHALGRSYWIDPHPAALTRAPEGRIHLVVEPRQAFGTGSHESTQLVLLLLETLPLAGSRVLDVGTGSGILAIAARALGAAWAAGFDIDADAVFVARQTVAGQPEPREVALFAGTSGALRRGGRFDLILANLIPAQLEPLLADLRALLAPGGVVVISGLMVDQREAVTSELKGIGLRVVDAREVGEWAAVVCVEALPSDN
jgi:ribosomal protein L11 methyltransferase